MASDRSSTLPASSEGTSWTPTTLATPASGRAPLQMEPRPPPDALDFALLRGAVEGIHVGVATTRDGAIVYANEALAHIFGAPVGGLERRQVSQLFSDETYATMASHLDEKRTFDGQVRTRGLDGRAIDAEVHLEQYSSEAQGTGGFLVVRDISFEVSALARLVDQLGAALFRVRVSDGALEHVSPAIAKLVGIDAATCTQHPVLLTELCSAEERERVAFLYRRVARGEIPVASAQVSFKRSDGTTRLLHIRATGRRDTSGRVRHIDGVIGDLARDGSSSDPQAPAPPRPRHEGRGRDPIANAAMELSHELLREGSQHLHALGRELRGARVALKSYVALTGSRAGAALPDGPPRPRGPSESFPEGALPDWRPKPRAQPEPFDLDATLPDALEELSARIDGAAAALATAAVLNRGVRRVLTGASTLGAPFGEVLANVHAILSPLVGGPSHAPELHSGASSIPRMPGFGPLGDGAADGLSVDAGDTAHVILSERVEELCAALTYLSLRAFRFAGSGALRISARRVLPPPPDSQRPRSRLSRPAPEREQIVIEIVATSPTDMIDTAVDISSDMLRTVPRPAEADLTYLAAQTLVAAAGGSIESDDTTFATARSIIRLRV